MLKGLFFLLLIGLGIVGYMFYTGQIDKEQAKLVIENVDDYAKAAVNSIDNAQNAVDTINTRNRETEKRIEESKAF